MYGRLCFCTFILPRADTVQSPLRFLVPVARRDVPTALSAVFAGAFMDLEDDLGHLAPASLPASGLDAVAIRRALRCFVDQNNESFISDPGSR